MIETLIGAEIKKLKQSKNKNKMNGENQNQGAAQAANEVAKKTAGRPRIKLTKVLKVIKNGDTFVLATKGKPKADAVMGEITVAWDYDRKNGFPADAKVTNLHTVTYTMVETPVVIAPVAPVAPNAVIPAVESPAPVIPAINAPVAA